MAKVDCSELSQTITDLLMSISTEPGIRNFDDAVHEMIKVHPQLTREFVSNAVIEATESKRKSADALAKKLRSIRSEPGIEKKTAQNVDKLNKLLEGGVIKPDPKQRRIGSETIERLRKTRSSLTRWLKNNNPTAEKRLKGKLEDLQAKIESGDIDPQRRPKTEFRKPIKALQDQIRQSLKTIADARSIGDVEKQIDALNKHLDEGTLPEIAKEDKFVSDPMRLAREIRDDLKKKLARSEPAQKKRLEAQIKELNKRLESGDILPKPRVVVPKSKQLEKLEFDRDQLQGEIKRRIADLKPQTVFTRFVQDPFNLVRNIITAYDFSAVFRQAGFFVLGHPVKAARNLIPMIKAFRSEQVQQEIDKEIKSRPNFMLRMKSGDFHAPIDGTYQASKQEELLQSRLINQAEKVIPGIAASNRAFVTFLNLARADSWDIMAATLSKDGDVTFDEAKAISNFVKVSTGRGSLGKFENAAEGLNVAFFAPRYVASRFQLAGGVITTPIKAAFGKNKRVQRKIAAEYARYLIGMATVYALAALTIDDEEFEWDPRSSDFGKIKIGNTRLDPLSGMSQVTVLVSRLVSGEIKSSTTGKISPIRGEDVGFSKGAGLIGRFLRYKLSPMFGTTLNLLFLEDAVGEPFGPEDLATSLLIPISFREIFETMKAQGMVRGTILSTLAIFGMGIQTYGSRTTGKTIKNTIRFKE